MEVHASNKGSQIVPQRGSRPPKGGQNLPQKEKSVRHGHRIYHTTTKIYPNMSVPLTAHNMPPTLATSPKRGIKPDKRGQNLPQKGNLCITTTVFSAHQPKFTQTCRSIVPLSTHNVSPKSGHFPLLRTLTPEKRKRKFAYAGYCICPRLTKIYTNMEVYRSNKGAQNTPKGTASSKGGPKTIRKGEICASCPQYLSSSDHNLAEYVGP